MGHDFLGTEHLLLGLLREGQGVAARTLGRLGLDLETTRGDILQIVGGGPAIAGDAEVLRAIGIDLGEVLQAATDSFGEKRVSEALGKSRDRRGAPAFVPRAKKVLELSLKEALRLGYNYIGTEHLLLAIVSEGKGVSAQVLVKRTEGLATVHDAVLENLAAHRPGS